MVGDKRLQLNINGIEPEVTEENILIVCFSLICFRLPLVRGMFFILIRI
jgi:hypothetical protein